MTRGYWIALIVIALIVIGGVAVTFGVSPNLPEKEEFPRAPDFKVNIIGGREVTLDDFRGQPLIVNFWASWCPPCRDEAPTLVKVSNKYRGKVAFLGIVYQDTVANVKAFTEEFRVKYPSALDPGAAAARAYKVTGVPETYVIDAKGRLVAKWIGAIDEANLTNFIEEALRASAN